MLKKQLGSFQQYKWSASLAKNHFHSFLKAFSFYKFCLLLNFLPFFLLNQLLKHSEVFSICILKILMQNILHTQNWSLNMLSDQETGITGPLEKKKDNPLIK